MGTRQHPRSASTRCELISSTINIKKDGLIKYVPASGTNPTTGSWNIIDLDTQPLTQFSGNLPISRIDGNLPANRLENIDMSKMLNTFMPGVENKTIGLVLGYEYVF